MDNQLPSALGRLLVSHGHEAFHVLEVGLDAASDSEIWDYATANSLVLVTKDQDFSRRALQGAARVQVLWVRLGNCRKAVLMSAFDSLLPSIMEAFEAGNRVVEIR